MGLRMIVLITYDIASDHRREAISTRLSGCGARVQLSIFECALKDEAELMSLLTSLEDLIDQVDDQIRIYMLSTTGHGEDHSPIKILGRRVIEERRDFWIL